MADTLKEFVQNCDDADTLREIAKEKFGTTIHNRTSLENTKAKVIELIDADLAELAGGSEPATPEVATVEAQEPGQTELTAKDFVAMGKSLDAMGQDNPPATPDPEPEKPKQRMLKNKRTGHTFIYTEALATNNDMIEV